MHLLGLDLSRVSTGQFFMYLFGFLILSFIGIMIYESTSTAQKKSAESYKKSIEKKNEKARKHAATYGMSFEDAKLDLELKNNCPKCRKYKFYMQPITISTRAGLSTVHNTYNVRICSNCNVEFVPRILL